jgi:hypothetical protein
MATFIGTGRDLTLTIDADTWNPQTSSAVLSYENTTQTYQTLDGPVSVVTGQEGTLEVTGFQDFGEAGSLFDALWVAAENATPIAFELTTTNGVTFSGDVIPQFPSVGSAADAALESSINFVISGGITKA